MRNTLEPDSAKLCPGGMDVSSMQRDETSLPLIFHTYRSAPKDSEELSIVSRG